MIDNGLSNPSFLNYIRKHIDRVTIRAGKRKKLIRIFIFKIEFFCYLVSVLQRSHEICLDLFNDSAFDMAR
jgi:hypothetical protein